ncbi:hypothetical protein SAY86_003167 [Trapa natans]|uniref:AT3G52170-like helix-turn-helix domain-containing protein n=1 Tax=Trapa natans TaxID=22666 RepID=A0AAN7LEE7_TRANT|nr:hypothetical protein SAY86_003167 [Trapa natans]
MAGRLRMLGRGGRLIICSRNSAPVTWLTKETSGHHGSTILWRGKSNAASAASDVPNSHRDCKRVSIEERRAMLESYINKYREDNAGQFPTASKAKAEVGGGFYTVRRIIQELKYNSNLDPSTTVVSAPVKKEPRKNRKGLKVSKDMRTQMGVDLESEDAAESISLEGAVADTNPRDETAIDHTAKSTAEGIHPDFIKAPSTLLRKEDQKIPSPPERDVGYWKGALDDQPKLISGKNHVKEETEQDGGEDKHTNKLAAVVSQLRGEVGKSMPDSEDPERQGKQYQASTKSKSDMEPPKKSTLWRKLKSFADEMLSIWRN